MHRRIARATVLTAATLLAAGCARSDFAVSRNDGNYWQTIQQKKTARAVQAPPPKILPETYFAAARLHETRGQFVEAIAQYRKAIAVSHKFVEAYHRLGVLLGAMGQFAEAHQVLTKAVQLSPKDPVLRNNLGFQLVMQEDWHGARREFALATELSPGFARAHVNLGMVLSKLGSFDEALEEFLTVLPEPDAYYNLGLMYRSQKRYQDAAAAFTTTLKFNSEFTAAHRQLEQLAEYLEPAKPVEAVETIRLVEVPPAVESAEPLSRESTIDEDDVDVAEQEIDWQEPCAPAQTTAGGLGDESPFFDLNVALDVAEETAPTPFEEPAYADGPDPVRTFAAIEDETISSEVEEVLFSEVGPWSEQTDLEAVLPCDESIAETEATVYESYSLPVSWNDAMPLEDTCVDNGAVLRGLIAHLKSVRTEINCLDESLLEPAYRIVSFDEKEPAPPPVAGVFATTSPSVPPTTEPDVHTVDLPTSIIDSDADTEPVVGPVLPEDEPILVREEWEVPEAEPAKKEPSARLDFQRPNRMERPDQGAAPFDGLLDLCAVLANESRCLADLESDRGPVQSLAFDPRVDSTMPPYMPFDLLLDVVWETVPFPEGELPVCTADPVWCAVEEVASEESVVDRSSSRRPHLQPSWR